MEFPKCCKNCQDYKNCDDRTKCCDFCDYCVNVKCTYSRVKGKLPGGEIEPNLTLPDYRGDDYGIDDYKEYEGLE